MKTRTDVLNHLIQKHGLKSYLEIGVQDPKQNFDKVICASKLGVDPDPRTNAAIRWTSDKFFNFWINAASQVQIPIGKKAVFIGENDDMNEVLGPPFVAPLFDHTVYDKQFDLIFIDGLHTAEQVRKDFENSLKVLSPNGFIVLHDCNPEKEEHTIVPRPTPTGHWNGDVYKFACQLSSYEEFVTVDVDNGCGVWKNGGGYYVPSRNIWQWSTFNTNRKELLNLISWDEFVRL